MDACYEFETCWRLGVFVSTLAMAVQNCFAKESEDPAVALDQRILFVPLCILWIRSLDPFGCLGLFPLVGAWNLEIYAFPPIPFLILRAHHAKASWVSRLVCYEVMLLVLPNGFLPLCSP